MSEVVPLFIDRAPACNALQDRFQRQLNYLRISVTDRCNLHCSYCRTPYTPEPRSQLLSFEEIERLARIAAGFGMDKLRITGGEPLARRDLPLLIAKLSAIPGIKTLAMSTNATLLAEHAGELAAAGLQQLNISLDSLQPGRFRALTGGNLQATLDGIDAALAAGFTGIKLNSVLMRGINDDEVPELIAYAAGRGLLLRFIELMSLQADFDWRRHYISIDEVLARPQVRVLVDTGSPTVTNGGVAYYLPFAKAAGSVGFIAPMSARFCAGCNRLRLTADGQLRPCLPASQEVDLRQALRSGAEDAHIAGLFRRAALIKPEFGSYDSTAPGRPMIQIGG